VGEALLAAGKPGRAAAGADLGSRELKQTGQSLKPSLMRREPQRATDTHDET
jgi:hypothetical protein